MKSTSASVPTVGISAKPPGLQPQESAPAGHQACTQAAALGVSPGTQPRLPTIPVHRLCSGDRTPAKTDSLRQAALSHVPQQASPLGPVRGLKPSYSRNPPPLMSLSEFPSTRALTPSSAVSPQHLLHSDFSLVSLPCCSSLGKNLPCWLNVSQVSESFLLNRAHSPSLCHFMSPETVDSG